MKLRRNKTVERGQSMTKLEILTKLEELRRHYADRAIETRKESVFGKMLFQDFVLAEQAVIRCLQLVEQLTEV